jgi:hypothetical protein
LTITSSDIGADGATIEKRMAANLPNVSTTPRGGEVKRHAFALVCHGPFFSVDSSYDPKAVKGADGKEKDGVPQLKPQIGRGDAPLALGSQIAGALLARARYIFGRIMLESGASGADVAKAVVPNEVRRLNGVAAASALTSVERLFGVAGYAGLLRIDGTTFGKGTPFLNTSVKLDHFSGAPIDKALFTSESRVGVTLSFALVLRKREWRDEKGESHSEGPSDDDRGLFDELVKDIETRGLRLGHATQRGFGWFEPSKGKAT